MRIQDTYGYQLIDNYLDVLNENALVDELSESPLGDEELSILDRKYEIAVAHNDRGTIYRLLEYMARKRGFEPVTRYHQTKASFNEFSFDNVIHATNDFCAPNGIFLKPNDHDIGLFRTGGEDCIQMNLFVKHVPTLRFDNRDKACAWYCENVPGYSKYYKKIRDIEKMRDIEEKEMMSCKIKAIKYYREIEKIKRDVKRISKYDIDEMDRLYLKFEKCIESIESFEETSNKCYEALQKSEEDWFRLGIMARNVLNDYFRNGKSGYGAIELGLDALRILRNGPERIQTFIVLNPCHVKKAGVTRDYRGNLIPLSQRFDSENPDIRY